MKSVKILLLLSLILFQFLLNAQSYSYITDRKFLSAENLIGYTFYPSEIEFTDGDKEVVRPGEIGFAISPQDLIIMGGEFNGTYNIISIDASKYGYILKLMDARNPIEQGHLKVILDGRNNVDALVFKKSREKQEVIFYQEPIDDDLAEIEKKYFTDVREIAMESPDSIWGTKIAPFLRISRNQQDRIEAADSVYFEFIEEIVTKEKPVKEIIEEEEEEEMIEEVVEETVINEEEEFIMTDEEEEDDDDFIDEDDPLASMIKKKSKKKKVEEVVEIEEEEELIGEEELAALEVEKEKIEAEEGKGKKEKGAKIEKAPKEKVTYKIVLRFNRWEGNGDEAYQKEEKLEFPIKTWKKLTSSDPNDNDQRYLFEYSSKPNSILVYLDESSTISKIQVGGVTYFMRGY